MLNTSFLRKLLKMYFIKMRKLTKKGEDIGNRKAKIGERLRKAQDLKRYYSIRDLSTTGKTSVQTSKSQGSRSGMF